jgi:hypothetical protein
MTMIELPIRTVAGLNAREHWRKRAKRVKAERITANFGIRGKQPPLPVVVILTRLSSGTLDDDNLQGAFKAIRDGVADAYGVADNDPRMTWRYAQAKCKRGEFGVTITLVAREY